MGKAQLPEGLAITLEVENYNGRARGTATARDALGNLLHVDTGDWKDSNRRERFGKRLAEIIKRPGDGTTMAINAVLLQRLEVLEQQVREHAGNDDVQPDPRELLKETPQEIIDAAEQRLRNPNLTARIADDVAMLGVAGERTLTTTIYTVGTSRHLRTPAAIIMQGPTSSGKTHTVEKTGLLFPPESIIFASQMTPQALFHMKPGSLRHRFIIAGERSRREDDEAAEASRALREMLSSGKLSKLIPQKDDHGNIVTVHIEQPGPIAYVETTTLARIFDEDGNRCILLATDERAEQTRNILRAIAKDRSSARPDVETTCAVHHAMQRSIALETADVVIPFADELAEMFPADRPESRRAFGHTLTIIEALALLHCRQRERSSDGAIIATAADYSEARKMLANPIARAIGKAVSDGAKRLFERLKEWTANWVGDEAPDTFTSSDVYRREEFSDRQVRGWLSELVARRVIELVDAPRGKPAIYRRSREVQVPDTLCPLPDVLKLFDPDSDKWTSTCD